MKTVKKVTEKVILTIVTGLVTAIFTIGLGGAAITTQDNATLIAQADVKTTSNEVVVSGRNLTEKLAWLERNVDSNTTYILEVTANEAIDRQRFEYNEAKNVTIILKGDTVNRTVRPSAKQQGTAGVGYEHWYYQPLFLIIGEVTLVLENNITLLGHNNYEEGAIEVRGGEVIMRNGSAIKDFKGNRTIYFRYWDGKSGTFTMSGGIISGNRGNGVSGSVNITMTGGSISGNSGVGVSIGEFRIFTMNGGSISDNSRSGVYVSKDGSFTMNGGTITGNKNFLPTNYSGGGGVSNYGTFTLTAGTISGNKAKNGGGVLNSGTFTMSGGIITNNVAEEYGGGVFDFPSNTNIDQFSKTGGTITGYETDSINGNVVKDDKGVFSRRGHAVYTNSNSTGAIRRKETNSGPNENLNRNASTNWDN